MRFGIRILLLLLLCSPFLIVRAIAQSKVGVIAGHVIDDELRQPVVGANVTR